MSVDKLVDSTQLDADLTSVANAIRTKGGTSASLAFPADFVSAIAAIPSGDSNPTAEEDDVIFIDYDGTIRYSYSASDFLALDALPANPSHDRLTAQGWNWTLTDAKAYVTKYSRLVIGQQYVSKNGKTRIFIELSDAALSPYLCLRINGSVVIDWGDGNTETVTSSAINTVQDILHNYAAPGQYVIEFAVTGLAVIGINSSTYRLLSFISSTGPMNYVYSSCVLAIELGENVEIDRCAFGYLPSLKYITLPYDLAVRNDGLSAFAYDYSLRALIIPTGMVSLGSLRAATALRYVSTHKSTNPLGETFRECYALSRLSLPEKTDFPYRMFYDCRVIKTVTFPDTATSVNTDEFANAYSLSEVRFTASVPPSASASSCLAVYRSDCKFYIPFAYLAAYLSATNYPSPSTYTYIGYAVYASAATLPASDGTGTYAVTWYATKQDAINAVNPISTGNGKEIYCRYS